MNETEYTYAVSYIKTLENKMLTKQEIENLINSEDLESAKKLLIDKGFGINCDTSDSIDEILKSELEKVWGEAQNVCPDGAPLELLLYKNDFHNLKTILKAFVAGVDWKNLVLKPCMVSEEDIYDAIKTVDFENLPEFIEDAARNAYSLITKTSDGQLAEVYLDKVLLVEMKKRADRERNDFLKGYINLEILIANMKIAIRAAGKDKDFIKDAMIMSDEVNCDKLIDAAVQGVELVKNAISELGYSDALKAMDESFSAFEKWCDNRKLEYVKKAKLKSFGFEPILGFLIQKEYELQAIRIIFAAKQNGVSTNIIRERLREVYA